MSNDIYIRNPDDPNYQSGKIEVYEDLEKFVQQIEMVLLTDRGEVLGEDKFGGNLETFIHTLNFNASRLEMVVSTQIRDFCTLASKFPYIVRASFYKGEIRDIGLLEIDINNKVKFNIIVS
jgi:hypothetical protein